MVIRTPKLTKYELISLGVYIDEYGASGKYLTPSHENRYIFSLIRKGYMTVLLQDKKGNPIRVKPTLLALSVYSIEKQKWGKLDADSAQISQRARKADQQIKRVRKEKESKQ